MKNSLSSASSLVFLQACTEEPQANSMKQSAYGQTKTHFSSSEGMGIYLKSIIKLKELLASMGSQIEKYLRCKSSPNPKTREEGKSFYNESTKSYMKIKEIIAEFIKALSVATEASMKGIFELLYTSFDYISQNVDLFYTICKSNYKLQAEKYLEKLSELFTQMQVGVEQYQAEQLPNSQEAYNGQSLQNPQISVSIDQ